MADKSLPWFRLYTETANDPKIDLVARDTNTNPLYILGVWVKLLCMASQSPRRGFLCVTLQRRYSNDDVTAMLRISNDEWERIVTSMINLEMIDVSEDKTYRIRNWDKRQFTSDDSQKRVEKHRKAIKNVTTPLPARYQPVTVTPPDTDTESDTESEVVEESRPKIEKPSPPPQTFQDDAELERMFSEVTTWMTIPSGDRAEAIHALQVIRSKQENPVEYMRPYYAEYKRRYNHGLRCFWLTEWAVTGNIPEQKSIPKKKRRAYKNAAGDWEDEEGNPMTEEEVRAL